MTLYNDNNITETKSDSIRSKILNHAEKFKQIIISRYLEFMPVLLKYQLDGYFLDTVKLEMMLLNNYNAVVGLDSSDNIRLLGYINDNSYHYTGLDFLRMNKEYTKDDIHFIIPVYQQCESYSEITKDNPTVGNFVIFRNKVLNYVNDIDIINHYANELIEISLSRYSVTIQSKITTFILGEENDESMETLVNDLYQGFPYVKASRNFDPEDSIINYGNVNETTTLLTELKREYQNKISELNNMLGLNSLGVDKTSGVSELEATGNQAFTSSNANIKLRMRQSALDLLSIRFSLKKSIVEYDNIVASELTRAESQGDDNHDKNNIAW